MLRARPTAAVASCVLASVAASVVDAEAQSLRTVSDKSARKLTPKSYKGGQRAQLELAVRSSRRGGRILVTFTSARLRRPLRMRDARTLRLPRPRLTLASPAGARPRIGARAVRVLRIELHLKAGAAASKLDGLLVARIGRRGQPLVVPLKGQAAATGTLTFDQEGTTLVSTHDRPFAGGKEDTTEIVPMHATGGSVVEQGQLATTILQTDDGKEARVELLAPAKTESALREARLRLTKTDGAGEYKGSLSLPAEEGKAAEALKVTARVQDRWWLPLMALLAGAALAAATRRYELWRGASLLKGELKRGVAAYGETRKDASGAPGWANLDDEIGDTGSWPSWFTCVFGRDKPTEGARKLYCQVSTARNTEALEDAKKAVDALLGKINRWRQIEMALRELKEALGAAQRTLDAPADDGRAIYEQEYPLPADDAASAALAAKINGQAAAIVLYDQGMELWEQIDERKDRLGPDDQKAFARYHPVEVYKRHPRVEARSVASTARLVEQLRIALTGLWRISRELPRKIDPRLEEILRAVREDELEGLDFQRTPSPSGLVGGVFAALVPDDVRTPEQIVSDVRRLDWVVFFVTLLVTAAAYLLTIYVGKSFGSWDDYISAFAAGFLGELAVNWGLLPLARSYRAGSKPVEPAAAAKAAAAESP